MKLNYVLLLLISLLSCLFVCQVKANEENEFAEFEDDFAEVVTEAPPVETMKTTHMPHHHTKSKGKARAAREEFDDDDFGIVDEDNEDSDSPKEKEPEEPQPAQSLKFADVPAHFRSNWASYQVEALVLAVIAVYLINYIIGRNINESIASTCFDRCKPILDEQFSLVADDGTSEIGAVSGTLRRETDYSFAAWCTGRTALNSMLIQMRLRKRQDVVSRVMDLFEATSDRMTLKFSLEVTPEVDPIVLALGEKKMVNKQIKEMLDLSTFATERKQAAAQFNFPAHFALYSDQSEVIYTILEPGVVALIKKYEHAIELIHISDQYTGPKPPEGETYTRLPEAQRYMTVVLSMSALDDDEAVEELLNLVFYLVEKVRKMKLSKEAKVKAERRRKEFEEVFMRNTHQFRQEAAQARREEKTRERKQKLLDEDDPDRQRRLEAKELKREAKAKQPKMKQLKMK